MEHSLSIALPAFNEAENVGESVEEALKTLERLGVDGEVVVVDDGSRDRTAQVVEGLVARYPGRVRLVRHEVNQGYGAAVLSGLTGARGDLIFFTDADRQFDLAELGALLERSAGADLVVGYRAPRRDPWMRRLNGWGWSRLVTLFFGYTARDVDCAFKLMRREVVESVCGRICSKGATFSAEFLVRAKKAGFALREMPVRGHRPRVAGNPTGARPDVILRAFKELFSLRLLLWEEARQIAVAPALVGDNVESVG